MTFSDTTVSAHMKACWASLSGASVYIPPPPRSSGTRSLTHWVASVLAMLPLPLSACGLAAETLLFCPLLCPLHLQPGLARSRCCIGFSEPMRGGPYRAGHAVAYTSYVETLPVSGTDGLPATALFLCGSEPGSV